MSLHQSLEILWNFISLLKSVCLGGNAPTPPAVSAVPGTNQLHILPGRAANTLASPAVVLGEMVNPG